MRIILQNEEKLCFYVHPCFWIHLILFEILDWTNEKQSYICGPSYGGDSNMKYVYPQDGLVV